MIYTLFHEYFLLLLKQMFKTPNTSCYRSEFFIQHDKEDRALEMNKGMRIRRQSCSSEHMLRVLGYQACTEASFVRTTEENSPYYPFIGPTTLSLTVHNKDAPRGFKFIGKLIKVRYNYGYSILSYLAI